MSNNTVGYMLDYKKAAPLSEAEDAAFRNLTQSLSPTMKYVPLEVAKSKDSKYVVDVCDPEREAAKKYLEAMAADSGVIITSDLRAATYTTIQQVKTATAKATKALMGVMNRLSGIFDDIKQQLDTHRTVLGRTFTIRQVIETIIHAVKKSPKLAIGAVLAGLGIVGIAVWDNWAAIKAIGNRLMMMARLLWNSAKVAANQIRGLVASVAQNGA